MRVVIQRVSEASVTVDKEEKASIDRGLLVLLGVRAGDQEQDASFLAEKTVNLRIFEDDQGRMNYSALDQGFSLLVVPQFTLYADCSQGRRPGFGEAAPASQAEQLYQFYLSELKSYGLEVEEGIFGAHMEVELVNWGPVTIIINSEQ